MDAAPADRREGTPLTHVGDGVRPWTALVSSAAILALGHDSGDDALVRPLSGHAGLDDAPAARPGPDRWRRKGGRTVPARVRLRLTPHRPHEPPSRTRPIWFPGDPGS